LQKVVLTISGNSIIGDLRVDDQSDRSDLHREDFVRVMVRGWRTRFSAVFSVAISTFLKIEERPQTTKVLTSVQEMESKMDKTNNPLPSRQIVATAFKHKRDCGKSN
jgi:hypothetical protein